MHWLLLTLAVYLAALAVYRRWPRPWTNPVALAVTVLLLAVGSSRALGDYQAGTRALVWLLKPAVVALGYAMHREWQAIRRHAFRFLLGVAAGAATSLLATPLLARALGAPETLQRALAFKSVTSGIAVDLAPLYGADPALTVPLVILTGILGAAFGVPVLRTLGCGAPSFWERRWVPQATGSEPRGPPRKEPRRSPPGAWRWRWQAFVPASSRPCFCPGSASVRMKPRCRTSKPPYATP